MLFLHSMAANRFQLRCQEWQGHDCCSGGWVLTLKGKGSVRVILVIGHSCLTWDSNHVPGRPQQDKNTSSRDPPAANAPPWASCS